MPDYKALEFKCGLEIHQQVESAKLFCRCPSIVHDENVSINLHRQLRAVAGESGKIDAAAKYEMTKGKRYVYEACPTSSCLVELDEEPPGELDKESLKIALQVAKLLNAKIVDEVLIMRKIVVDGSNVSGFQRTALVAEDGYIDTPKGKVTIPTICLEEEAAQKIDTSEKHVTYRLDRLGITLIEIATGTDIVDPQHAEEVAARLGMILRSTGKVKRGIGTIRQDVNVSIKGGARTEIKGFQELRSIPKVIDFEIARQTDCIRKQEIIEPAVRRAEPDMTTSSLRPMPGGHRMYPETDVPSIPITTAMLDDIEIPRLLEDQIARLAKDFLLDKDIAATIISDNKGVFFERMADRCANLKPSYIADVLLSLQKNVKKQHDIEVRPSEQEFESLLIQINSAAVPKEALIDIIALSYKEKRSVDEIAKRFKTLGDQDLEKEIKSIIGQNPGMPINALIGKVMGALRGKADGKKITDMVKRLCSYIKSH